jgi:DNA mismatch repair protein MutS
MSMDVLEKDGEVVFLKRVRPGPSDNSYGLHVAKLAGLPAEALSTAAKILSDLDGIQQPPAPAAAVVISPKVGIQPLLFPARDIILQEIMRFPVEKTSPLDALNRISKWKDELGSDEKP